MRSIALLATVALAGLATASFPAKNANVDFSESLQCAGCKRGGFVFCGKDKSGNLCLKPDNTTGIADLEKMGYNCDNGISGSPGYYPYELCAALNPEGCGRGIDSFMIDLPNNSTNVTRDIYLEYSNGCGYRAVSRCGFPMLNITNQGYDVAVSFYNDKTVTGDPEFNYPFPDNETASFEWSNSANGPLLQKFPGMDDNSTFNCSDPMNPIRKMYVLITNLQKPAEPKPAAFLETEARMLQGAEKTYVNATVTFTTTFGAFPEAAFSLVSGVALAFVALFSVFAF